MGCGNSKQVSEPQPRPSKAPQKPTTLAPEQPQAPVIKKLPHAVTGVVIFGAPASGKGTQCEQLVAREHLVHISTGDLLRAQVSQKTPLGLKAAPIMEAGQLVPDAILMDMVYERLCQQDVKDHGFLLDGFPRTKPQAEALAEMGATSPDLKIIVLDVPDETLIVRVSGRRIDPETKQVYHIKFNPPPAGLHVIQRSDDTEEKLRVRLATYNEQVQDILQVFKNTTQKHFDGSQTPENIATEILEYVTGEKAEKPTVKFQVKIDVESDAARKQIIKFKPRIGISMDTEETGGVVITGVSEDSPADKGGLKEGDKVAKINDYPIFDEADFKLFMHDAFIGEHVSFGVEGERKVDDQDADEYNALSQSVGSDWLEEYREERRIAQRAHLAQSAIRHVQPRIGMGMKETEVGYVGASVSALQPNGPAANAGLKVGDSIVGIDGIDVVNNHMFKDLLLFATIGESLELDVLRMGSKVKHTMVIGGKDLTMKDIERIRDEATAAFIEQWDSTQSKKRKMIGDMHGRRVSGDQGGDTAETKPKKKTMRRQATVADISTKARKGTEKKPKKRGMRRQATVASIKSRGT